MMQSADVLAVVVSKGQIAASAMANISLHSPFKTIEVIEIEQGATPADDQNLAVDRAIELYASWILFIAPGEHVNPDALAFLLPALDGGSAKVILFEPKLQTEFGLTGMLKMFGMETISSVCGMQRVA